VFEAQTLANFIRFPMMFLGGVFIPVASLPLGLRIVARLLPLTYAVEALRTALAGGKLAAGGLDLAVLALFAATLFGLATRILAHHLS
jgi:ABC-2 type transport system permease protein